MVAWYGSTGNVALEHSDPNEVRRVLHDVTGVAWAVVSEEQLDRALGTLATLPEPSHAHDERPTPGLAFAVTTPGAGEVSSTDRAALHLLSDTVVAVWKLDLLLDGKLDRDRRRGGWGAVFKRLAEDHLHPHGIG